jgi:hypothetical protein
MLAPVTHIVPLATIRRERALQVPGKVVVRKGQKVSATDVIAEARLNPEHLMLDIARGLGLPENETEKYLHCKPGMLVAQGDVLAGPVGLTKRVIRAPKNGKVILAGEGQILMELEGAPQELKAGIPGTIASLLDERGAVIETTGALIQVVWGNNRVDYGLMYVLLRSPDEVLTADGMDVSMRGSILLGGHCEDAEVLKTAATLPVRGLILSSMDATLLPLAFRMRYPIVVTDGFGKVAMNSATFNLLTTNERREVALNAESWDRYKGHRPEIVIPLPAAVEPPIPQDVGIFETGAQVRVLRPPRWGMVGTITEMIAGLTALPNGIRSAVAEVQLESGQKEVFPLANLEVLK